MGYSPARQAARRRERLLAGICPGHKGRLVEPGTTRCVVCAEQNRQACVGRDRRTDRELTYNRARTLNPDYRAYRKTYDRAYVSRKYHNEPAFKLAHNLRTRLREVIGSGKLRSGRTGRLLGCSYEDLRTYLESQFCQGMTWENHGLGAGTWQIDHIRPLASFDLTNQTQLTQACHYTNLQPLWYEDHLVKTAKDRRAAF